MPAYAAPYAGQTYQAAPAPAVPAYNTHGEPVDESDRESVEEAREETRRRMWRRMSRAPAAATKRNWRRRGGSMWRSNDEAYYDD